MDILELCPEIRYDYESGELNENEYFKIINTLALKLEKAYLNKAKEVTENE